jgi:hypothetical protein
MQRCKSCGADIRWVRTTLGKWMPLDAEPVLEGNIVLTLDGALTLSARQLALARALEQLLYRSHFVTCPNAETHRSRGQR